MSAVIQIVGTPSELFEETLYVHYYDPDEEPEFTSSLEDAHLYADKGEAFEAWRAVSKRQPVRMDGKPNRPLTYFTVSIHEPGAEGGPFAPKTKDAHADTQGESLSRARETEAGQGTDEAV